MADFNVRAPDDRFAPGNQRTRWKPLPGFEGLKPVPPDQREFVTPEGQDAIREAVHAGLGILVSLTSDGGALSLTVYDGQQPFRAYASREDEVIALWQALAAMTQRKRGETAPVPSNSHTRARSR